MMRPGLSLVVGRAPAPPQPARRGPFLPSAICATSAGRIDEKRVTSGANFRLVIWRQKFTSWRHFGCDDEIANGKGALVGNHGSMRNLILSATRERVWIFGLDP